MKRVYSETSTEAIVVRFFFQRAYKLKGLKKLFKNSESLN